MLSHGELVVVGLEGTGAYGQGHRQAGLFGEPATVEVEADQYRSTATDGSVGLQRVGDQEGASVDGRLLGACAFPPQSGARRSPLWRARLSARRTSSEGSPQLDTRTITAVRPATARSAKRRRYPPWTRPETVPQSGQAACWAELRAENVTTPSATTTFSIVTRAR